MMLKKSFSLVFLGALIFLASNVSFGQESDAIGDSKVQISNNPVDNKAQKVVSLINSNISLTDEQYKEVYSSVYSHLQVYEKGNWGHLKQDLSGILNNDQLNAVQSLKKDITDIMSGKSYNENRKSEDTSKNPDAGKTRTEKDTGK